MLNSRILISLSFKGVKNELNTNYSLKKNFNCYSFTYTAILKVQIIFLNFIIGYFLLQSAK